jgi:hypothetical protein
MSEASAASGAVNLPPAVAAWVADLLRQEQLEALLLLGSYARGEAGADSDIDLVGVRSQGEPEGRYPVVDRIPLELVIISWNQLTALLDSQPSSHFCQLVSQYRGAIPLYDPAGRAVAFLEQVERIARAGPPPLSQTELAQLGFELRHGRRILAQLHDSATQHLLAAELARLVAYAALRQAGRWPPSLKRLFPTLERVDPDLAALCVALLASETAPVPILDQIAHCLTSQLPIPPP